MSEYSLEVLAVTALLALLDLSVGARLLRRPAFWMLLALTACGTLVFGGYLDARPVVRYGWHFLSGVQVWVVPVEDFGYGAAMVLIAITAWELLERRRNARKRSG